MFKQFLQASALQFVQLDSCRLGSVNENLAVLLMAHKFQGKTPDMTSQTIQSEKREVNKQIRTTTQYINNAI